MSPLYLNVSELRAKTGLSISTIRRRMSDGTLRYLQPGGPRTRVLFPLDAIEPERTSENLETKPTARSGPQPRWLGRSEERAPT